MNTFRCAGLVLTLVASATGCKGLVSLNGKPVGSGTSSSGGGGGDEQDSNNSGGSTLSSADAAPPPPGKAASWCEDTGEYVSKSDYSMDDFKDIKVEKEDPGHLMYTAGSFGKLFCTTGEVKDRKKIVAMRDKWLQLNDLDDQDFIVLLAYSHARTWDSQKYKDLGGSFNQVEPFDYSHSAMVQADKVGEKKLSMIGRFMLVNSCNHSATDKGLLHDVLCTREPLDVKKAYAEIDANKDINVGTRYKLRALVRETWQWYQGKKVQLDAMAKEDPGIAKVIKIAEDTRKEWERPGDRRAEMLASVEKMEAATALNKTSAFAGCDKTTKAAWEAHLKGLKLPKVPGKGALSIFVEATLDTTEGYLAYEALRMCSAGSEENIRKDSDFIGSDVVRRGPRTATVANWLAAAADIKFDNRSLKIHQLFGGVPMNEGSRWEDPRQGVIDTLQPFEGGVEITFKRVVEPREDCLNWVDTNQIVMFEPDGDPIYRRKCLKWGMVKTDLTAEPIKIGEVMAQGLKPGMYLLGRDGLAIVATASAKSATPIWVFGGSVK